MTSFLGLKAKLARDSASGVVSRACTLSSFGHTVQQARLALSTGWVENKSEL